MKSSLTLLRYLSSVKLGTSRLAIPSNGQMVCFRYITCSRFHSTEHNSNTEKSSVCIQDSIKSPIGDNVSDKVDYIDTPDREVLEILARDMIVTRDFLSEAEEKSLLEEIEKYLRKQRYEFDHWDHAIHGFRETEKRSWTDANAAIIKKVQDLAFGPTLSALPFVHVLDIAKEGYIKPHVDAVRFCGEVIAGMCLLSSCVMRLALEKDSSRYGDVFLPRRCLYLMKNRARFDFTHEVLQESLSKFKGQVVPRDRRISVICRCEPRPTSVT